MTGRALCITPDMVLSGFEDGTKGRELASRKGKGIGLPTDP